MSIASDCTHRGNVTHSITVVGVGTSGCRAVECMARSPIRALEFLSIDTDPEALAQCVASKPMQISLTGLRSARPQEAKASAERAEDRIRAAIQGADLVVLVAGMTDATAVGAAPVVARIAQEVGILAAAVTTLPGEWDGTRKRLARAQEGVADLRLELPAVFVLPSNTLGAMLGNEDASVPEVEAYIDGMLARVVSCMVDSAEGRGDVVIDFRDLERVLGTPGGTAVATVDLHGSESDMVVDRLLTCPLLEGVGLAEAQELLVLMRGASEPLQSAGKLMRLLADVPSDTASLLGATLCDEGVSDHLQLTLIATGMPHETPEAAQSGQLSLP